MLTILCCASYFPVLIFATKLVSSKFIKDAENNSARPRVSIVCLMTTQRAQWAHLRDIPHGLNRKQKTITWIKRVSVKSHMSQKILSQNLGSLFLTMGCETPYGLSPNRRTAKPQIQSFISKKLLNIKTPINDDERADYFLSAIYYWPTKMSRCLSTSCCRLQL